MHDPSGSPGREIAERFRIRTCVKSAVPDVISSRVLGASRSCCRKPAYGAFADDSDRHVLYCFSGAKNDAEREAEQELVQLKAPPPSAYAHVLDLLRGDAALYEKHVPDTATKRSLAASAGDSKEQADFYRKYLRFAGV
jgi:hypothetical protein